MSGRDLVLQVGRTLTRFRRFNLAAALLFPVLLGAVICTAYTLGLLPSSFLLPALGILVVVALFLYERGSHLLRRVTAEDAGRHLDAVTGAKERFLTLATLPESDADPVREAIEAQVAPLAEHYLTEHSERIKVEPTAKLSLFLSPLAAVVLGLLLLHHEALVETPTAEANALSVARAEAVRELAERTPDLPDAMKEQLEQLATTLEERGLFSEEALKQLEQSLDGLEKLESAGENPQNITIEEAQKIESKTSGEEKDQAKESGKQSLSEQKQGSSETAASTKQNRPEANDEPSQPANQPTPAPSESLPPNAEQLHEQISKAQQQQQQQDAAQQPPSGEEKQGVKSLQQKDDGDLKKGQKEQPQGESTKQGAAEQKDGKKESPGEKGEQEGAGQQDDPKKGTAGVGDGKGEAKGKQSKDQIGGETDSGSDSSGAKEGAAKNDAAGGGEGDEQGAKQGEEKGKGDASGKAGEKSGQGKSQGRNDAKGEMKPGAGDSQSAQTVKEELESLKEEMTSGKPQESKSGEKGQKQGGDKAGGDKQGAGEKQGAGQQGGEKSPKSDGAKGGKSGEKAGDKPGHGANGKQPNGGEKQGGEKGGKEPGSKGGSESAPGGEPKGEAKQPPDGEKGESQGAGNKPNRGSPDGDKQSMGEGVVPKDPNGKLRSKRPDALPAPSDTAPRFGPFDGGKDGDLKGKAEKVEEVSLVDNSEKIVVRSLGENDGKLYRNSGSAQAKTKLGEGEFAKPKSDVAESSQPIPVEYRDILR